MWSRSKSSCTLSQVTKNQYHLHMRIIMSASTSEVIFSPGLVSLTNEIRIPSFTHCSQISVVIFSFFIIYRHSVGLVLHFQNTLPITHLDLLESGFLFKRRIARTSILSEDRGSHLLKRIIIKHKICAKGNIFKQIFTKMNYFEQI